MLFNSIQFLIFFPVVTVCYFALPHRFRWVFLLLASCVFYMAFVPVYIVILLVTILVDYWIALRIHDSRSQAQRRILLILCVSFNVLFLAVFKYYNFAIGTAVSITGLFGEPANLPLFNLLLPIGLSFHTFQALSYVVEVYWKRIDPERHLGTYALFVMFYPQLVAGPIERPQNLLPQFREIHQFEYDAAVKGLLQMAWGFIKKVVIADRIAPFVGVVFADPEKFSAVPLLLAMILFSFQIYCDFSGYSDIALGSARVMGFRLMTNFRRPYAAGSISQFWASWHISLSTWFRDYVYIPLGGNRVKWLRWQLNLLIVFTLSGLWHGASWLFVTWGVIHAVYIISENVIGALATRVVSVRRTLDGLSTYLGWARPIGVFVLVTVAWVFFRAETFSDAIYMITSCIPSLTELTPTQILASLRSVGLPLQELLISILAISVLEALQYRFRDGSGLHTIVTLPTLPRWLVYVAMVTVILVFGKLFDGPQEFIYFQF
jgi:alginate O-acetyltransferase complex protein AlgI